MMNQAQIAGRAIADAMLVPVTYENGERQEYTFLGNVRKGSPSDFFWRVAPVQLEQWGIKKECLMDIVDQLSEMGPIETLRDQLGITPGQGIKHAGLVLRSRKNPKILANCVVNSRSAYGNPYWGCGNMTSPSNFNDYGQVIECYFYYDIYHETVYDGEDARLLGDMNALLWGPGITGPTVV